MRKQFMLQTEWITTDAAPADDAALGAWLRLHSYCAGRLNDGRLAGAKAWSDDTTRRLCVVKRRALDAVVAAGLAQWDGQDLVLKGYDHDGQRLWQAKSTGGKTGRQKQLAGNGGGNPSGSSGRESPPGESRGVPEPEPRGDSDCEGESDAITPVSDAADAADGDDDQTMKFIRSLGGHLTFRDEDKRPDWRAHVAGMTLEQIREVFDWARAKGIVITLPGKGPGYFGGVRAAMRDAARKAAAAALATAEAEARAATERNERSGKDAEARAKEQANRAKVAGVLAVFDEDPTRWLSELATAECNVLAGIREAFNKRRPLALHMRHLDALPAALVEAGSARAPEFTEATEGMTT